MKLLKFTFLKLLILISIITLSHPNQAEAGREMHSPSAQIAAYSTINNGNIYKYLRLKSFLSKYDSPLKEYSYDFISASDKYGLDWRLLPSITGVESTFGKRIPYNSYNAYGWNNGNYKFESWEHSIDHVSEFLKVRYVDRGYDTIDKIAPIYAPPSSDWAWKVKYFANKLDPVVLEFDL